MVDECADAPLVDAASPSLATGKGPFGAGLASSSSSEDTGLIGRRPFGIACWRFEESAESSDMLDMASSELLSAAGSSMRVCRSLCSASKFETLHNR